jgi:hypothetical protein
VQCGDLRCNSVRSVWTNILPKKRLSVLRDSFCQAISTVDRLQTSVYLATWIDVDGLGKKITCHFVNFKLVIFIV